jgi:hypothetical protein
MLTSLHSIRKAAVGAVGAGMVTGAMLFAGTPIAQAAPPPAPGTSFEMSGPHGAPGVPLRGGVVAAVGAATAAVGAATAAAGAATLVGAMVVGAPLVWAIGPGGTGGGDLTPPG